MEPSEIDAEEMLCEHSWSRSRSRQDIVMLLVRNARSEVLTLPAKTCYNPPIRRNISTQEVILWH